MSNYKTRRPIDTILHIIPLENLQNIDNLFTQLATLGWNFHQ